MDQTWLKINPDPDPQPCTVYHTVLKLTLSLSRKAWTLILSSVIFYWKMFWKCNLHFLRGNCGRGPNWNSTIYTQNEQNTGANSHNKCPTPQQVSMQLEKSVSNLIPGTDPNPLTSVSDPWYFGTDPDPHLWSVSASCSFRQWPTRCQQKIIFFPKCFCLLLFEGTVTSFFTDKKS
jgi:hypothetical protein